MEHYWEIVGWFGVLCDIVCIVCETWKIMELFGKKQSSQELFQRSRNSTMVSCCDFPSSVKHHGEIERVVVWRIAEYCMTLNAL